MDFFSLVSPPGLEPGTRWLRVSCSANWATERCAFAWGCKFKEKLINYSLCTFPSREKYKRIAVLFLHAQKKACPECNEGYQKKGIPGQGLRLFAAFHRIIITQAAPGAVNALHLLNLRSRLSARKQSFSLFNKILCNAGLNAFSKARRYSTVIPLEPR